MTEFVIVLAVFLLLVVIQVVFFANK